MMIDGFKEIPLLELGVKPLLQVVSAPGQRSVVAQI